MITTPELPSVHQPLTLAMAGVGERLYGLVRAYVEGPGSRVFVLGEEAQAHVLLVDLDNPAAAAAADQFRRTYARSVMALSMNEPAIAGAIWVRKPISMEGLAQAASLVRQGWLAAPEVAASIPRADATAVPVSAGPVGNGTLHAAEPTDVASTVGAPPSEPRLVAPASSMTPMSSVPPSDPKPAAAVSVAPQALAPSHLSQRRPASVKAPVATRRASSLYWTSGAAVGVAAVAAWLLLPGRPSDDRSATVDVANTAVSAPADDSRRALESAVQSGLQDVATSGKDAQFVALQLASTKPAETPEQLKARLDALASDSAALRAHNEDVYNKVAVTETGRGRSPEAQSRRALESIVALSTQDRPARLAGFVGAIGTEAKAQEDAMRTIVVQAGDTLSAIAKRAYGDPEAFGRIFEANPRVLASPHHIFPGQVLRVPGAAR